MDMLHRIPGKSVNPGRLPVQQGIAKPESPVQPERRLQTKDTATVLHWQAQQLFGGKKSAKNNTSHPSTQKLFQDFKTLVGKIHDVEAAIELLDWDADQHMPAKAAGDRGHQMATLSEYAAQLMTSEQLGQYLKQLQRPKRFSTLSAREKALVETVQGQYEEASAMGVALHTKRASLVAQGRQTWKKAREQSDFKIFEPVLTQQVALLREMTQKAGYEKSPYDVLLSEYEPGMTTEKLDPVFNALKTELVPLLKAIRKAPRQKYPFMKARYEKEKQLAFSRRVLTDMGFDFERGLLSESVHPFCAGSSPNDIRLATRIKERDFFDGLGSTIHEGGHGLVDQGNGKALIRTPLLSATMGIHESQSRLWENQVGKSRAFVQHYAPILRRLFPEQLKGVKTEEIYRAINQVQPSLIRTAADEVTYNLHVLLRYELEKDMIEGKMAVKDLPEAWNRKMKEYLGVVPKNDAEGVLQDMHWSEVSMGYFPTYTLGNLYAAQFFAAAKRDIPDLEERMAHGDFKPLKQWLNRKIHHHGKLYSPDEIVKRVTGEALNPKYFVDYLWDKYGEIYGLKRP